MKLRKVSKENFSLDISLFQKCIHNEDVWKLFNYTRKPNQIYYLKYNSLEDKIKIWDEKGKTVFYNNIKYLDLSLLNCMMKKITK